MNELETPEELHERLVQLKRILGSRSARKLTNVTIPLDVEFYSNEGYILMAHWLSGAGDVGSLGQELANIFPNILHINLYLSLEAHLIKVDLLRMDNKDELAEYFSIENGDNFDNSLKLIRALINMVKLELGRNSPSP